MSSHSHSKELADAKHQANIVLDQLLAQDHSVAALSTAYSYFESLSPNVAPLILPQLLRSFPSLSVHARNARTRLFSSLCAIFGDSLSRFLPQFVSLILHNFSQSDLTVRQSLADALASLTRHCTGTGKDPSLIDAIFVEALLSTAFTKPDCASTCFLALSRILSILPVDDYPSDRISDLLRRLVIMIDDDHIESMEIANFKDILLPMQKCIELLGGNFGNLTVDDLIALIQVLSRSLLNYYLSDFGLLCLETIYLFLVVFVTETRHTASSGQNFDQIFKLLSSTLLTLSSQLSNLSRQQSSTFKNLIENLNALVNNCKKLIQRVEEKSKTPPRPQQSDDQSHLIDRSKRRESPRLSDSNHKFGFTPTTQKEIAAVKNNLPKRSQSTPRSQPPKKSTVPTPSIKNDDDNNPFETPKKSAKSSLPRQKSIRSLSSPRLAQKSSPKPWINTPNKDLNSTAHIEVFIKGSNSPVVFSREETEEAVKKLKEEEERKMEELLMEETNQQLNSTESRQKKSSHKRSVLSGQAEKVKNVVEHHVEMPSVSPVVRDSIASALSTVFTKDVDYMSINRFPQSNSTEIKSKMENEQALALERLLKIERDVLIEKSREFQRNEAGRFILEYKRAVGKLQEELTEKLARLEENVQAKLKNDVEIFEKERRVQLAAVFSKKDC
ncbi:hypothetical protein RCL1_006211 [Eukaryota sp. TZLM3-RCL]